MGVLVPAIGDRMHPAVSVSDAELGTKRADGVDLSRSGMPSISVHSGFLVSPRHADLWIQTWRGLAALAKASPGCHHFRLVRDRNDDMYFAIYSEWDDTMSYVAFEQRTGVKSLEADLAAVSFSERSRFLEVIPAEPAATRLTHDA